MTPIERSMAQHPAGKGRPTKFISPADLEPGYLFSFPERLAVQTVIRVEDITIDGYGEAYRVYYRTPKGRVLFTDRKAKYPLIDRRP